MKDNRSGKDRQKPVKGAVDKAGGKKAMPVPRGAAAKPTGENGRQNTGKVGKPARATAPAAGARPTKTPSRPAPAPTAAPTTGARPTKLAPRPERPTTAGQRPTATRPTPTKKPSSAPPKSPQASTSSSYMDMLNQMRSQTSSAQGTGPLSFPSL
jgi:hypothetical protein